MWSEREVQRLEELIANEEQQVTALRREHARATRDLKPAEPTIPLTMCQHIAQEKQCCAVCGAACEPHAGRALVTNAGSPVCWACGRAHAPALAAQLLAGLAELHQDGGLDFVDFESMVDQLVSDGEAERALRLEAAMGRLKGHVRFLKEGDLGAAAAWR